jgi:hypothetical protein
MAKMSFPFSMKFNLLKYAAMKNLGATYDLHIQFYFFKIRRNLILYYSYDKNTMEWMDIGQASDDSNVHPRKREKIKFMEIFKLGEIMR